MLSASRTRCPPPSIVTFRSRNGGDVRLFGGPQEPGDAVEAVPVGEGEAAHTHPRRSLHDLFRGGRAEPVAMPTPYLEVGEPHQSTNPTSNQPPDFSRARSTTTPPERRTLTTNLSLHRSPSHHSLISLQRSRISSTLLREHPPVRGCMTSARPWLTLKFTGSSGA